MLLLALMPAQAADMCPWFTHGSAARILGGAVVSTIALTGPDEGSCKYTREAGTSKESIEIYVASALPSPCPPGSESAAGIGNEAISCSQKTPSHGMLYQVDSRVRTVHITVLLRLSESESQDAPQQEIRQAAEQVAGNLF
jgi:hypothetical protein